MSNLQNFEAVANVSFLKVSPAKIRRVLDQIKYLPYLESVMILSYLPNKSCPIILKALKSAVSNLKSKCDVEFSSIYVKEVVVNSGPVLKRFRSHAQGRAFSIKKRMSHIVIFF